VTSAARPADGAEVAHRLLPVAATGASAVRARLAALRADAAAGTALDGMVAQLLARLPARPSIRCAIVASTPAEAAAGAAAAERGLGRPGVGRHGTAFVGISAAPRIAFLFPGQGAPVRARAGDLPAEEVQLAVVEASLSALRALRDLGVEADVALGHSLGELTALHWAGAFGADALLRLARGRGRAMTRQASSAGAMATVRCDDTALAGLTDGIDVTIACYNAPRQRVVSGAVDAVEQLIARARQRGVRVARLNVVGAFHSPLMHPALPVFDRQLAGERLRRPQRRVYSSVTGGELRGDTDLRRLLTRQIADPVRFEQPARAVAEEVDLALEVGPGRILAGLVAEVSDTTVVSTRTGERGEDRGLVEAAAAAFAAGAPVPVERLATGAAA
jgi:enediyne polyketide synthase